MGHILSRNGPSDQPGTIHLVEVLRIGRLPAALGDLSALIEMAAHVVQQRGSECRSELLGDYLRIQLGEPLWPRRYDDSNGPRGHAAQQLEMSSDECAAGTIVRVGCDVQEHRAAVRIDADGEC